MLLHIAQALDDALTKKWESMSASSAADTDGLDPDFNRGLQILLLDGEEAFRSWTTTDSIYGARSLAAEWEATPHAALSTYTNPLDSIELFVLLDLLGSKDPKIPSYYPTTHWAYQKIADTEARLRNNGLFRSATNHKREEGEEKAKREEAKWFFEPNKKDSDRWMGGLIGDDHEPFIARGVEILHVIPTPFPRVWHEMSDDGAHLDMDTTEDWAVLVAAFAAEWMELEGFLQGGGKVRSERELGAREDDETRQLEKEVPGITIRDEL